jgi:hypothetical protein
MGAPNLNELLAVYGFSDNICRFLGVKIYRFLLTSKLLRVAGPGPEG